MFGAFDALTGETLWSYSWPFPGSSSGPSCTASSPLIIDGVVYGGYDNTVFALDAQSGSELWTCWVGKSSNDYDRRLSSFIFADGVLYFCTSDGKIYALKLMMANKFGTIPMLPLVF